MPANMMDYAYNEINCKRIPNHDVDVVSGAIALAPTIVKKHFAVCVFVCD